MKHVVCLFSILFLLLCFSAVSEESVYPSSGISVPEGSQLLTGAIIGEETGFENNPNEGRTAAFDGSADTFYNPSVSPSNEAYCGIELSDTYILTCVCVLPRAGCQRRLDSAWIQGSNDMSEWHTLYCFSDVPNERQWNAVYEFTENTGYRYFRYINFSHHGDVAELEFYGYPGYTEPVDRLLRGEPTGEEAGWGGASENGCAAAFDGDTGTCYYASSKGGDDSWCGIMLEQRYVLTRFRIWPRTGCSQRVLGACLQGSLDGASWYTLYEFDNAVDEHSWTVVTDFSLNAGYNYYRYINKRNFGDVAEIELYGYQDALGDDPENYTIQIDLSAITVTLDDGKPNPDTITVSLGGCYAGLPVLDDRKGLKFLGWYTLPEDGYPVTEGTVVTILGNHTLYAVWG